MIQKKQGYNRAFVMLLLFLCLFSMNSHGQVFADLTVSVNANRKPLYAVLDDLTEQTGFYFTFDSRLAESREKITLNLENVSIKEVIDTLFGEKNLNLEVINKNIVIVPGKIKTVSVKDTIEKKQPFLEVLGTIHDENSEKPLPYATVALVNYPLGTITNEDGSFLLRISDTIDQPILVTSYIGYKNQYTPISVRSGETLKIKMNRNVISLQEVIIRYQDPVALLSESLKKVPINYYNEPSGLMAYYREKVMKDDKCMIFSEAVVNIAKAPYTSSLFAERSRLMKGRKIINIDVTDTVVLKIRSGLNTMLQLDIIKHPPDFLSPEFHRRYNLHFTDLVSYRDQLVYVISFKQREDLEETLFRGNLYIDRESLAIVAADFEYDPMRIGREQEMFVAKKSRQLRIRPVSTKYHVEYANTGGKYHLSQVNGEVKFKVRKKRQWIASKYQINLEMAVTNVQPKDPPHIRLGEQIRPSTIMAEESFEYDPDFWGEYNIIYPETSLTEALERIEKSIREVTLE